MTDGTSDRLPVDRLSRRAFLGGAAGLAGTLALGLGAPHAEAAPAKARGAITLAYWNGEQLVDSARLPSGEAALRQTGIRVTVHGEIGPARTLRGLTVHYPLGGGSGATVPHHAWAGSPQGSRDAAFTLPVVTADGLALTVRHVPAAGEAPRETLCRLALGEAAGQAKLRAGTYVLANAGASWRGCRFEAGDGGCGARLTRPTPAGPASVGFDYLVLAVAPA